jgi:hypothetical protein
VEKTGLPGENHRPDAWEEKKGLLRNLTAPNVIHQANDFNKSLKIFGTIYFWNQKNNSSDIKVLTK